METSDLKYAERVPLVLTSFFLGIGLTFTVMLATGWGQDVPGTGGLTRYQVAEMLYECDRGEHKGYCVADVNIRPENSDE